ncbi:hypothetical protein [Variimorphobacter saccharofermentans]|uniref:hypothetical protein n=1 Tax=Variimorphobacter saccharofermentans TaxID=2755051 RepID=UPI001E4BB205|nr:hypothetical protein [Variimorphobacter saccharofermentans]
MAFRGCNNNGNGFNCGFNNGLNGNSPSFVDHISEFIGETVTIFTTSGGASGCGFTGFLLSVNSCFVRLVTDQGLPPSNPLAENICGEFDGGPGCQGPRGIEGLFNGKGKGNGNGKITGSVCDIPIDRIAAFCHNAV